MEKLLDKKKKLKEGEMIQLCFDEAFKIMFGNSEHIEILTMLLSKIFKVPYEELEGKVEVKPLKAPSKTIGEKKCERDVVVSIKHDTTYNIVLEVNVKKRFYQTIIDRNLYYTFQTAGHTLIEAETYDKIPYTFLINFNTFFVNNEQKDIIEEFHYRDKYGYLLTEKSVNYNINIEECYKLWYTNDYQGKFEPYEEDLVLLCAAMMVDNQNDFHNIVSMVRMKPEIKDLMEGLVRQMNNDEKLVTEYRTWKEEEELINKAIINEVREDSFNAGIEQGKKEMVLNLYKENIPLEVIAKCANLTIEEVKKIIDDNQE